MMMILGGPDFCVQLPNDLSCQIGASVAMGDGCVPIFREVLCKCCLLPQEMYLSQPFDLFEYISSIDQ